MRVVVCLMRPVKSVFPLFLGGLVNVGFLLLSASTKPSQLLFCVCSEYHRKIAILEPFCIKVGLYIVC